MSRRGFLAGLGLVAGAGALAPLVAATRARRVERLEASRPLLGTWVRIAVRDGDRERAAAAVADAFAAIRTVDGQMSIHRPDSQLAHVNAAAGRNAVAVDDAVREVVARACATAAASGGAYDPTVLPLLRCFGFYGGTATAWPAAGAIDAALARVDHRAVRIDGAAGTLGLARAGMALDLGSIGKGWALDRAVAALRARGVTSAMVDVGGNVYGLGVPEDDAAGWSVGVFHPVSGALERVFVLRDRAVATSGNSEQSHLLGHVRVGHLFDARRGRPAHDHLSASVVAASGTVADALSTTAFVLGPDRFSSMPGALDAHFVG